ncbi:protein-export chaperone SecB [Streptococcus oricebi]|uniref:Preprotein translocase subunit SecB n=1 Tax=Streptococcus oricebi TaxID=1547447 RepID=A0ABS5B209_9STRE|nr:protein-export chaperone SecB [Streptococcus oricebi]MBP2622859.1 hypothetical protein [Streptococcus oricebi]
MTKPVISLERYKIDKLLYFHNLTEEELSVDSNFEINFQAGTTKDEKNGKVTLKTKIIDKDNSRKIEAEISGYFSVNDVEDVEKYLVINGTAIIFPYLRSAVSMISALDSAEAIVIPTVNVLDLIKNNNS